MVNFFAVLISIACIQKAAAQAGCCSAWWFAPEGSVLTRLQSTMIIPTLSTTTGLHYVWQGMEPRDGSFVFQNVIGDQQPAGQWSFATWYGPYDIEGHYHEYGTVSVGESDYLTTDFHLNTATNEWIDNWILEPGKGHSETGSGGVNVAFPQQGALTDSVFEIELQEGATWDFGPVTWTNILMEANTTSTDWCTEPRLGAHIFNYSMAIPIAEKVGEMSICYIASLTFESP